MSDILELRDEKRLSWTEIGERLGLSASGARYRYARAKAGGSPAQGSVRSERVGNVTEVTGKGEVPEGVFIRTIDELIEFADVDMDQFEITREVVNFWGSHDNPNSQVKAWLVPREPVAKIGRAHV